MNAIEGSGCGQEVVVLLLKLVGCEMLTVAVILLLQSRWQTQA